MRKLKLLGLLAEMAVAVFLVALLMPVQGTPQGVVNNYSTSVIGYPAVGLTPVTSTGMSWANQGSATFVITNGIGVFTDTGTGTDTVNYFCSGN